MFLSISFFFQIFFMIFSLTLLLTGIVGNLLIMTVNYRTWIKSSNLSSFDMILSSLSISRCICLFLMFLHLLFSLIFLESELMAVIILNTWIVLDSCSLWIVTLLNIFYCVKITNFNHSLFLWLKRNLSLKTPWLLLLLACLLAPVSSHFLPILLSKIPNSIISTQENVRNNTMVSTNGSIFLLAAPVVLGFSLQFVINLISCSLLISSLRRHMQEMQKNANSFWNPQTEAHVGAMKVMIYFLVLYVPYSIAQLIIFLPSFGITNYWIKGILVVVNCTYSPGHTIFIILLHPKLKARIKTILRCN